MSNGELGVLVAEVANLSRRVGEEPAEGKPTGLIARVAALEELIGHAPNDATDCPGTGLCKVVADLAVSHKRSRAAMVRAASIAGILIGALFQVVVKVVEHYQAPPVHRAPPAIVDVKPAQGE